MQFLIHQKFQLNRTSFSNNQELLVYSKTISLDVFSFLSDFFSDSDKIIVKTSGSTGTPKMIELKKKFMTNSALATAEFFDLKENTTALLCINPSFIAGKMMLVRAMVLGWKLDIVKPSSNPLKGVEKTYDFCAMVPMQVHHSFDNLHQIRKLIIGGGILSKEIENKLQTIKTTCFVTYGMTETVTHVAVKKIVNCELGVTNFKAFPNVYFLQDKRGCLVINAPKIAKNKVVTNDLVEIISDTEFQWLGRYDNIINSGGIKLIPEQIEEKLAKIIEQRFFVSSIPDKILGKKLVLVVERKGSKAQRRKGTKGKREKNVISSLSTSLKINSVEKSYLLNKIKRLSILSKYEAPKEIYFIQQFVETDTKKIQRKKTLDLILL
ncbi:MAG: AMP-binding protein [Flavobacteriaceae bacterium]|nr:AMP-binding protein [Flavobacteriaceae bacterium]